MTGVQTCALPISADPSALVGWTTCGTVFCRGHPVQKVVSVALCNQMGSLQPGGFLLKAVVCHPSRSLPARGKMKCPVRCREHLHFAAVSVGLTDDIASINNTRHPLGHNASRAADCHRCTAAPYGVHKHQSIGEILTAAIEFN